MFRATSRLRFIEPQLASLVDQPPEGRHWIHEIKHDGYRCIVIVERGGALVYTRNGYDWSDRYPSIVRAASLTSNASQRSLMVRLLSRTLMEFPISRIAVSDPVEVAKHHPLRLRSSPS